MAGSQFVCAPLRAFYGFKVMNGLNNKAARDMLAESVRLKGVRSLWRGNLMATLGGVTNTAVAFALNSMFNRYFVTREFRRSNKIEFWRFAGINLLSGGLAGLVKGLSIVPIGGKFQSQWMIILEQRTRRSAQKTTQMGSVSSDFWRTKLTASILTRAMYFGVYETLAAPSMNTSQSVLAKLMIAELSVIIANLIGHPFERCLHLMNMSKSGQVSSEFLNMNLPMLAYSIAKNEGAAGLLWRHLPHLYTTVPGALCLVSYDLLHGFHKNNANQVY